MRNLSGKQWWVIWLTAAIVLALWWSTADQAALQREATDPIMVRLGKELKENVDEQAQAIKDGGATNALVVMENFTLGKLADRRRDLLWAAQQSRAAGTGVVFAVFLVCWLERRK